MNLDLYTLHAAAGWAQTTAGQEMGVSRDLIGRASVFNHQLTGISLGLTGAFGDDPKDFYWTQLGANYHDYGYHK